MSTLGLGRGLHIFLAAHPVGAEGKMNWNLLAEKALAGEEISRQEAQAVID